MKNSPYYKSNKKEDTAVFHSIQDAPKTLQEKIIRKHFGNGQQNEGLHVIGHALEVS